MLIIVKSCSRIPSFPVKRAGKEFKLLSVLLALLVFPTIRGLGQQLLTFNVNGKSYSAEISWVVKHNSVEFKSRTAHNLDIGKATAFDLAVFFDFKNDSLPGNDIVWGFQFSQNGNLITPASNEKRSRSKNQFQRFNVAGAGAGGLVIIPKAWQRTPSGRFEAVGQGAAFTLGFNFSDSNLTPAPENAPPPATPVASNGPARPNEKAGSPKPLDVKPEVNKEEQDYTAARNVTDTIQKIRALIDFVDKYAAAKPKSPLVASAIKDIPLGISVPAASGDGTYTYTLDYPVNLYIDTAKVKGWDWTLTKTPSGKYELVLIDLKDTVHAFPLIDAGKNAPFNLPKELSPFDKIQVELLGESKDSFQIRLTGGVPPFIVFLSKNGFPAGRFVINTTNTVKTFSKSDCEGCKSGAYTLEVYSSDFTTLLLRIEDAIHIRKIRYLWILLFSVVGFPVVFFIVKLIPRLWEWLMYQKTLLEIRILEIREIREAAKRKKNK